VNCFCCNCAGPCGFNGLHTMLTVVKRKIWLIEMISLLSSTVDQVFLVPCQPN
jgi:hypothetical protein